MFYSALVAVYEFAAEVAIDLVEVKAVLAGDEAHCVEHVGTEFIHIACLAGIVAVHLDAACERASLVFETGYVVGLPAVHAQVEILHLLKDFLCIDADSCIALFGNLVGFFDSFLIHGQLVKFYRFI